MRLVCDTLVANSGFATAKRQMQDHTKSTLNLSSSISFSIFFYLLLSQHDNHFYFKTLLNHADIMKKLDLLKVSFIVRSDKKEEGTSPVLMVLYLGGRRAYVSTGLKADLKEWDGKNGRFRGSSPKDRSLNEILERMRVDVFNSFNEFKYKDGEVTVESFRHFLKGEQQVTTKNLIELCNIYNECYRKLVGIELHKDTFRRYLANAVKLGDFVKLKFKASDIPITSIKYSFAIEFEHYLKTDLKLHQNTLVKCMQYLLRVLDYAVKYEWLEKNVLTGYKCPVKESRREYLTHDELQRIIDKDIKTERLREVRDCFVFCCYTGYAYKDAANLTPEHIGVGITGRKWIYTSRQKNENVSNVPLLEQAQEIIDRYKDHPVCVNKNRLLPMKSNQKLNAYLKELADICGINKTLTTHMARHTFATTVLLANGVSMEATSKMLGHNSIKTTQIYGRILESRVGAEMEMLSEKLAARKPATRTDKTSQK